MAEHRSFLGNPLHASPRVRRAARPLAVALALLAAAVVPVTPARAGTANCAAAHALVEHTTERLLAALRTGGRTGDPARAESLVRQIVLPHVAFDVASRLVLGKYWARISPAQKARFETEFQTLMVRTYATAIAENVDAKVRFLQTVTSRDGSVAFVRTRVPRRVMPPVNITYRLHHRGDEWRVVDIAIDGVSLVTTWRGDFVDEIGHIGIDRFIARLAEHNDRTSARAS